MPIIKRISDPYGAEGRSIIKQRKEGRPPTAPRKPSLEERAPFVRSLKLVPVGKTFTSRDWGMLVVNRYSSKTYEIWGQTLYIWPRSQIVGENLQMCTGAMIGRINPDKRGIKPSLLLDDDDNTTWYGSVIHWIRETCYGG